MQSRSERGISTLALLFISAVLLLCTTWGWNIYSKQRAVAKQVQMEKAAELEKARKEQEQLKLQAVAELERTRKEQEQVRIEKAAELEETRKEQDQESRAQASVRNSLKDPDSAKFGKMVVVSAEMACIPVNARNSFGGYTGEKYVALKNSGDHGGWVVDTSISGGDFADSLCKLSMLSKRR